MSNNFFINAYKYSETKERSQLENFTTESFVFVLKFLILKYPEKAKKVLALFNINIETKDIRELSIETQKYFSVPDDFININKIPIEKKEAKPDIVICDNKNRRIIIEVKVESSLNIYNLNNEKTIDQVDFYKNLKNIEEVYTLSKHHIEKNIASKYKIRWFQIYEILVKIDSFVVKEFCNFLEDNGMGERKILNEKTLDILETVDALSELIKNAWEISSVQNKKLNAYTYISSWGFGYYILDKDENNSATKEFSDFIGVNKIDLNSSNEIKYKNSITFWTRNKPRKKDLSDFEEISLGGYILKEKIELTKLIELKNIDKQEQLLSTWIKNKVLPRIK